jgi:hypothetical protein
LRLQLETKQRGRKMSSTPKELLERFSQTVTLLPGLSEQEIARFQERLPGALPDDVHQLLLYSAGFDSKPFGTVRFSGHGLFEYAEVFPKSLPLLPDDCGNFWVVDVNPQNGAWGSVFYACHDPAVIVVQARDLMMFLSQLLDPSQSEPKDAVHYVHDQAASLIWEHDPWLVPVQDAQKAQDAVISKFAEQLPDNFRIADLRSAEIGSGFSWGKAGPTAGIRRNGTDLIFAVEQKSPGFLSRMFSRRSSA